MSAAKCVDLRSVPGTHAVEDEEELPVGLSTCVSASVRMRCDVCVHACLDNETLRGRVERWRRQWPREDFERVLQESSSSILYARSSMCQRAV